MTHWRRKPDPVELTAVYIRTLADFVAVAIVVAEAILICRLFIGGN